MNLPNAPIDHEHRVRATFDGSSDESVNDTSDDCPSAAGERVDRPGTTRAVVAAVLVTFPLLFMWPVLRPAGRLHLRTPSEQPDLLTDIDGAVWLGYVLQHMRFPWSPSTVTAVPTGESIWRWQAISQGLQIIGLWLLTRFFGPTFSVNLFVLVGWILTGLAAFLVTRMLGGGTGTALTAGVLCQMLPSIPKMAANYTSYVFIAVPLVVLATTVVTTTAPTWRRVGALVSVLGCTLFFDPYWFYFSVLMIVVAIAVNARAVWSWLRQQHWGLQLAIASAGAVPMLLIAAVTALDRRLADSSMSRPLGVTSRSLIDLGLRSPSHWFRSSFEGVGTVVPLLAIGFAIVVIRRRSDPRVKTVVAIGGVMFLLSTRTRLDLGVVEIESLAEYMRFAMPGVRFFQRAALIAEAIMCILAALALRELLDRVRSVPQRVIASTVAAIVLVGSFNPFDGRAVFEPAPAYADVREILGEVDSPVVVALPFTKVGRAWFEFSLLDVPSANALNDAAPARRVAQAASHGPAALASYLESIGVTHVLAVAGQERYPLLYELEEPRFTLRHSFVVSGFERPRMSIQVFDVHALPGDRFCIECNAGNMTDLGASSSLTGNYGLEELAPDLFAWWLSGSRAELSVDSPYLRFSGVMSITFGNVPCGTARVVEVRHADFATSFELSGTAGFVVDVPVDDTTASSPVIIDVDGPDCRIETDPRVFSLQVFRPSISLD